MDEYGYTAVARTAIQMFEVQSRQSGRTTRMIERAQDGDHIVTTTEREADRLRQLRNEAGKFKVRVSALQHDRDPRASIRGATGRTFYDHLWVREFLLRSLSLAELELERIQRDTSRTVSEAPESDPSGDRMVRAYRAGSW